MSCPASVPALANHNSYEQRFVQANFRMSNNCPSGQVLVKIRRSYF